MSLLDFNTRMYNPEFGRFGSVDIRAEDFTHQSPFVYADNNPVRFIDFMGMYADEADSLKQTYLSRPEEHTVNGGVMEGEPAARADTEASGFQKVSAVAGAAAASAEFSSSTFRLTNSKGAWDPRLYGNGWAGNQWVSPTKVAQAGKATGSMLFGIGMVLDGIGLYLNEKNPDSNFAITPESAAINQTIGVIGLINPFLGAPLGITNTFYPGGIGQALKDRHQLEEERRERMGNQYLPLSPKSYW